MTIVFAVPDISCGHCRDTIAGALAPLPGVENVNVDLEARSVEVHYRSDQIDPTQFAAAIESVGYAIT